jgi:hypothetical protein
MTMRAAERGICGADRKKKTAGMTIEQLRGKREELTEERKHLV